MKRFLLLCWLISAVLCPALAADTLQWVGRAAPDFSLITVNGMGSISLKDYRGKVLVLDFWASWCAPCQRSLPLWQEMEEASPDLRVLAVNIDDQRENALTFMRRFSLDLTVVFDPDHEVVKSFQLEGLPTVVVIDPQGIIRSYYSGYQDAQLDSLQEEIDRLLRQVGDRGRQ